MILDLVSAAAELPAQLPAGTITNETGRVLATLDDWRAILFGALLIIAVLLAALLTTVGFAFRAWMTSADAISAVREALAALKDVELEGHRKADEVRGTVASLAPTIARIEARIGLKPPGDAP